MSSRVQCFPEQKKIGQMHKWTHRDCDHMHKTCTSSTQTKYQHGEGEVAKVLPIDK